MEDDDRTMQGASDDKVEPSTVSAPVVGFTMTRAQYDSVMLAALRAETDALFRKIDAEAHTEAMQAIMDGNVAAYVASSAPATPFTRFLPGRNDHKTSSSMSIVDLISTYDVHTTDSGEEE
ncbi:unnamed protein product [Triticum turgidum subsp. durum]|uniref:Uncharacterized protein n=1 Tax=Triticum turgidum subsp. durum TaxID=4567 RepID=A0A9R0Q801_TRITD|nr:unnamed protein product [Triticum turgidum subsp. durum]